MRHKNKHANTTFYVTHDGSTKHFYVSGFSPIHARRNADFIAAASGYTILSFVRRYHFTIKVYYTSGRTYQQTITAENKTKATADLNLPFYLARRPDDPIRRVTINPVPTDIPLPPITSRYFLVTLTMEAPSDYLGETWTHREAFATVAELEEFFLLITKPTGHAYSDHSIESVELITSN